MHIPEELLEQFARGKVLLLIGEGISAGVLPSSAELAEELARRCNYPPDEPLTLPRVAGYYELTRRNRQGIVQLLRDRLIPPTPHLNGAYRAIAQLRPRIIVSACYDRLLEEALRAVGVPVNTIVGNSDLPYGDDHSVQIVALWGTLDQPTSLLITEDDRRRFLEKRDRLSDMVRGALAQHTLLFLGFDADDGWFCSFYDSIIGGLDRQQRRPYLVGPPRSAYTRAWWDGRGAEVIDSAAEPFLTELLAQLAARVHPPIIMPPPDAPAAAPLPERPYKLLDYYEASDAAIFFGRQREQAELSGLIHAHRLVVLYGASGVGKTSLLLAGVAPRLAQVEPPYKYFYVRALEDPATIIRRAVRRRLPETNLPADGSLVDFLAAATTALDRPFLIILDQFEEFFIRLSPQFRADFIAELGALYDARDVPVKVVLSLREDWLAAVSEIEERIPEVFHNRMRVLPLNRAQAEQAITAPVMQLGRRYEPALVERLLDDLSGADAEVLPPQLQIVCSALYGSLSPDERVITLAAYEHLGGARGVLQQYLADELARLPYDERALAQRLLEELVTSQGTKAVKAGDALARALAVEPEMLTAVLKKLLWARLLRVLEHADGNRAYELAHEYLIREIVLSPEAQRRKEAEELLRQEVENWQRFGTLLATDKLALIGEQRAVLRLDAPAQELLLRSALDTGHDVQDWLDWVNAPALHLQVLADKASSPAPEVRQRVAAALGTQDVAAAVEPLLALALRDANPHVRTTARASLARLKSQRPEIVAQLHAAAQHADRSIRRAALETFALLPLHDLPPGLRRQVVATRARQGATWLAAQSSATPLRRAIVMTAGLLVMLFAIAYIYSINSYYIATEASPIAADRVPVLVVRRGHPRLLFPGINRDLVKTGISLAQVADDHLAAINNADITGLWPRTTAQGYRVWGADVVAATAWQARARLLWYLGQREGAIHLLETAEGPEERRWAVDAIADALITNPEFVPQVIAPLLERLHDDDPSVRYGVATALGQAVASAPQVAPQVVAPLIEVLHDDPSVRDAVAAALGRVAASAPQVAPQVVVPLIEVLHDDAPSVRAAVATALGQAVASAPQVAPQVVAPLVEVLHDDDPSVRAAVATALGQVVAAAPQVARQVVAPLIEVLHDNAASVSAAVVAALGQVAASAPQVVAPLVEVLHDDPSVRVDVTTALGQVAAAAPQVAPQVVTPLIEVLHDDAPSVRAAVATALGRVVAAAPQVAPQVVVPLIEVLHDDDPSVRVAVTTALGQVAASAPQVASQVVAPLVEVLHDNAASGPAAVVAALGQVAASAPQVAPQVVTPLIEVLHDNAASVRYDVATALGQVAASAPQVAPQVVAPLIEVHPAYAASVRYDVATALGQVAASAPQVAPQVVAPLIEVLHDDDSSVRYDVATALGQVAASAPQVAPQVVVPLIEVLHDDAESVRAAVATALGRVVAAAPQVAPQVVAPLLERLHDDASSVRAAVATALGRVVAAAPQVAPQVVAPLLERLHDDAPNVRAAVASSLTRSYATQAPSSEQWSEELFSMLTKPENALIRPIAARALFLIVLEHPESEQAQNIIKRLQDLANDPEPVTRIWANTTLEMLKLATLAQTAHRDPKQHDRISASMQHLSSNNGRDHFFGEDVSWAADEAIDWLKKQTKDAQQTGNAP